MDTTNTNYIFEPINSESLKKAIELLEKGQPKEEDIFTCIATLGKTIGLKTLKSEYLPKGTILIGTGDRLKI